MGFFVCSRDRILFLPDPGDKGKLNHHYEIGEEERQLTIQQGLTLEQVDKMLEETTPRTSAKWRPHETFAHELGMTGETGGAKINAELVSDVERKGSAY